MEIKCYTHGYSVSWYNVFDLFCAQFIIMGQGIVSYYTLYHINRTTGYVVWYIIALNEYWCLLWIQEAIYGSSCAYQSNTSSNTPTVSLYSAHTCYYHGWHITIWLYIYPAIPYLKLHMVQSDVLYVWFPISGIHNIGHNLL